MKKLSFFCSLFVLFILASCSMMVSDFKDLKREVPFYVEYIGECVDSSDYDYSNPIKETLYISSGVPESYEPEAIEGFECVDKQVGKGDNGYYVRAFYKRKLVQIAFYPNGAIWDTESEPTGEPKIVVGKYGSDVTIPDSSDLVNDGYIFAGWSETPQTEGSEAVISVPQTEFIYPEEGKSYYAVWVKGDTAANYTVKYMVENRDAAGTYYEAKSETFQTAAGAVTNVAVTSLGKFDIADEDKDGFEVTQEIQQQTVLADGSTVVNVYIDRKTVKLTFAVTGGTWKAGGSAAIEISGKYNTLITYNENVVNARESVKDRWPVCDDATYTFAGWLKADAESDAAYVMLPERFPVKDDGYKVDWNQSSAYYTVEYYKEILDANGIAVNVNGVDSYYVKDESLTDKVYSPFVRNGKDVYTAVTPSEISGYVCTFKSSEQQVVRQDNGTVVKVYYNLKSVTVTFDANGGSWTDTSKKKTVSGKYSAKGVTVPAENPALKDVPSKFLGWAETYKGAVVNIGEQFPAGDKTYYAVWEINGAHVVLKCMLQNIDNDEFTEGAVQNLGVKTPGAVYTLTAAKINTIAGFTLVDKTGDSSWTKVVTPDKVDEGGNHTSTTVFTADFTRNTVTLNLDFNGGKAGDLTETVLTGRYGAAVTLEKTPVLEGKVLSGWEPALPDTFPAEPAEKYVAQWNSGEVKYTVKHNLQKVELGENYEVSDADTETLYGTSGVLTEAKPKTFAGYTAQTIKQETISGDGSTVVNVYYNRNKVKITLDLNGGSGITDTLEGYYGSAVTAPDTTNLVRDGYTFSQWEPAIPATFPAVDTIDISKALWSANTYKITYKTIDGTGCSGTMDDQTFTYGKPVKLNKNTYTRTGYTFDFWSVSDVALVREYDDEATVTFATAGDVTLYAYWLENGSHKVIYKNVEATDINDNVINFKESEKVTLTDAERTGYKFEGWFETSDYNSARVTGWLAGEKTDDVTLYAKWAANTNTAYTVIHKLQNASDDDYTDYESEEKTGTTGKETAAAAKTYEGFTAGTVTQKIIAADGSTIVDIYYARKEITLTLDLNGGSGIATTITGKYGDTVTKPVTDNLKKAGYTFTSWDPSIPDIFPKEDASYKAQWTVNKYKVTFNANGGSGSMADQEFTYGTPANLNENTYTLTGFTFSGWSTTAEGSVAYENKDSYSIGAGDVTLYAVWTENGSLKITYKNIIEGDVNSNPKSFKESETVTLSSASRAGYTFNGWYDNDGLSGEAVTGWSAGTKSEAVTLYAKWTANTNTAYTVKHYQRGLNASDEPVLVSEDTETLEGTTDTDTEASAKSYIGFTAEVFSQSKIKGDGSTVVSIYYSRNTITFTLDANGGSNIPSSISGKFGSTVSLDTSNYGKTGYSFNGWSPVMQATFDVNCTYTAQWKAASTSYTVTTLKEKVDGSAYDTSNETRYGTTGTTTNISAQTLTGFTAEAVENKEIAADGSTVITIKYNRNTVTYKFEGNGGSVSAASISGKYESALTAVTATRTGYTLSGWSDGETVTISLPATFGASDATYTAQWTANANTKYTVKHVQESTDGKYTTVTETVEMTGKTGDSTAAEAKTYDGFTAKAFEQTSISGDGTTVVEIDYERNKYTVTLDLNGGTGTPVSFEGKYGTTLTVTNANYTYSGYKLTGWSDGENVTGAVPGTYPLGNKTYKAQWEAADITYTVKHMQESLDGTTYAVIETESLTGKTGASTAAAVKTYSGFTAPASVTQQTITAGSAIVIEIKYTRNSYTLTLVLNGGTGLSGTSTVKYGTPKAQYVTTNPVKTGFTFTGWNPDLPATFPANDYTAEAKWSVAPVNYTVIYSKENLDGTYDNSDTETKSGDTNSMTAATAKEITGFTAQSFAQAQIKADGSTTVTITYKRTEYSLTFELGGGTGVSSPVTGKYGATVPSIGTPSKAGYTFTGWSPSLPSTFTENKTITAQWTANTNTAYKVEHYQQNVSGSGYTLKETDSLTGTTDTQTSAAKKSYTGFNDPSITQGTIAGDGSTVVKVYYDRKTITFTLDLAGGTGSTTATGLYGATVSVTAPTRTNYTFAGWSPSLPTTFTSDGSYTATWNAGVKGVVVNSLSGDVAITSSGTTLTATPPAGAGTWTYTWYVDNNKQSSTTNTCSITSGTGNHQVMIVATSSRGMTYTSTALVTVE